jgi:hypothetical protein
MLSDFAAAGIRSGFGRKKRSVLYAASLGVAVFERAEFGFIELYSEPFSCRIGTSVGICISRS